MLFFIENIARNRAAIEVKNNQKYERKKQLNPESERSHSALQASYLCSFDVFNVGSVVDSTIPKHMIDLFHSFFDFFLKIFHVFECLFCYFPILSYSFFYMFLLKKNKNLLRASFAGI